MIDATPSSTSSTTTTSATATTVWARELAPQQVPAAPVIDASGRRPSLWSRTVAASMVAAPLSMTAWFLVEAAVLPREDPTVFLGSVAAAPVRYVVATGLVALAGVFMVPAAVGTWRLLAARLPRLAGVVATLSFLCGLGLAAQAGFRAVVSTMVGPGSVPDASVAVYTAFQDSAAFTVLITPGLVFGGLSTVLVVGALLVTRLVRRWVPVALVAGMVLASGELADPVTVGGALLTAAANVHLARRVLRMSA